MVSLFRRGSAWWVTYQAGGRQFRRSLGTDNRRIALDLKTQVERRLLLGEPEAPEKRSLAEYLEEYRVSSQARKRPRTHATDMARLEDFVGQADRECLGEVTTADVSRFLDRKVNRDGITPTTVLRYREILHAFFQHARRLPVVPTLTSRGLTGLVIALVLAIEAPAGAQDTRRAPPPDFALVGGTVIDGTASPPRPKCTVVVRGGRIAAVGPDEAVPEGVTTIDVTGRCILPGMIDMHGHLYANDGKTIRNQFVPYALLYLAGGVTTVFSPGDFDPEGTVAFRESVERGEAIGPRILTAGPYFDHRPSHLDWIRGVNSADEARQLFDAWKGRIDGVKVYTSIQEPELVAVIGSAHEAGLRVVGHLDSVTATRAIELGIDGLEHGIFTMSELAGPFPGWFPTTPWLAKLAALDVDAPPMKPLIASIVERHVVIDPTTVTFQALLPDFVAVAPDWKRFTAPESVKPIDDLFAMVRQEASKQGPQWLEALHGALRKQNQFVKAVHDRGGIVVTGTDPVGVNLVPGYALHRELRNLVEAGFTPLEAIKAATQDAARALRRDAEIGTIAPGKVADLVVVGGDPAHAIDDVGRTEIVIAGGVRHDPAELRRLAEKGIK